MTALPVVLVHGIRLTGTMWRPQHDRLARTRAVCAPDLPGHGRRHAEPFSLDAAVAAVAEAVDTVGGRALVVGASLGGYVGIATAATHPDKVAGLVVLGATAVPSPLRTVPYLLMAALGGPRGQRFQRWVFRRRFGVDVAEAALSGGVFHAAVPDVRRALGGFDPLAALRRYPGPVRFVNGARDPLRVDEARFRAACRGELELVADAGHLVSLSHPETVAAIVERAAQLASAR